MIGLQSTFPVLLFAICMSHISISAPVLFLWHFEYLYPLSECYPSLKAHFRSQMPLLLWFLPCILSSPRSFLQDLEGLSLPPNFHCILSELLFWTCYLYFPYVYVSVSLSPAVDNWEVKVLSPSRKKQLFCVHQYICLLFFKLLDIFSCVALVNLEICGTFCTQDIWGVLR